MTSPFTDPRLMTTNKHRSSSLKAPPTLCVDLAATHPAPAMSSSPARPVLESILDPVPSRPLSSGSQHPLERQLTCESILLTCPDCLHISHSRPSSSDSPPACPRCLRHFKEHERKGRRNDAEFTRFPRLLEERAREHVKHEEEVDEGKSVYCMITSVFRGRRGSDVVREDDASQRSDRSWGSGWKLWNF
jgi:hypothetical protein